MFTFHFLRAAGTAQQQDRCSIEIQVQIYRCNHTCQLGTITQKPYGVRFKFVFLLPRQSVRCNLTMQLTPSLSADLVHPLDPHSDTF